MSDRNPAARTALHVVFALLFVLAAFAFGRQALDGWASGENARLVIGVLATLGAVSLAIGSLRRALRGPDDAAAGPTARRA